MLSRFHQIPGRYRRTDRRTDRIAISISRVSVPLTRDKKRIIPAIITGRIYSFILLLYYTPNSLCWLDGGPRYKNVVSKVGRSSRKLGGGVWTPRSPSGCALQLFYNYRMPILRSSGGRAESLRVGSENMENLMTVVDRLDELQASSVECSSTRQRTGARRMDVHVDT